MAIWSIVSLCSIYRSIGHAAWLEELLDM